MHSTRLDVLQPTCKKEKNMCLLERTPHRVILNWRLTLDRHRNIGYFVCELRVHKKNSKNVRILHCEVAMSYMYVRLTQTNGVYNKHS